MHSTPRKATTIVTTMTLTCSLLTGGCIDDDTPPQTSSDSSSDPSSDSTGGGTDPQATSTGAAEASTGDTTAQGDESGDESSTGQEPSPSFEGLQACMEQLVEGPQLSAAGASVVLGDEIIWSAGFGVRHPDEGGEVDEHTRFRVASVTKMMTAMAALAAVDEGSLDLDTPMGELLPPFGDPQHPDWTAGLTTRQLLSHQGGLLDYLTLDGPRGDEALADAVLGEEFAAVPFLVEPGAMWNYSNANYSVAGMAVEQAAGISYREVVEQRVFAPLGMDRSTFDVDAVEADGNYAWGVVGPQLVGALDYDNGWARPAGYAWASAEDLGRLARFVLRGDSTVLSEAAHLQLVTPELDTALFLDRMHYGLGLFHSDFIPTDLGFVEVDNIDHGGNLPGYTTLVHTIPEHDLALGLVANGDVLDLYPCVAAALGDLPGVTPEPVVPQTQAELTELADYVGDYVEPAGVVGDFSISQDPGGLQVQMPVLDELNIPYSSSLNLYARDNFIFSVQGFDFQLTGIRGDDGSLEYVRTRLFVGQRAPAPMPARGPRVDPPRTRALLEQARRAQPSRLAATFRALRPR